MTEWSTASDKRRMTERQDSGDGGEKQSPTVCLTDRGKGGHTTSSLQSVRQEVCDGDNDVSLFPFPCLDGEGGVVVMGDLFSLF